MTTTVAVWLSCLTLAVAYVVVRGWCDRLEHEEIADATQYRLAKLETTRFGCRMAEVKRPEADGCED